MAVAPERVVAGELRSHDPATLELVGSVPITSPDQLEEVVEAARIAQRAWARTTPAERRSLLRDVSALMVERADELARTVTAESGKPVVEALTAEVLVAVECARWLAANAEAVLRAERLSYSQPYLLHKRGRLVHEPLGTVALITPWNFPFAIPFTEAATAVAAGDAVVVKPSELTPLTGAWVERMFADAGAPPGLVQVVQGEGETVGAALVRAPEIAKLFFTGSVDVGRLVATAAGEVPRPVVLELGGKDPMLVLADADLDRAVEGALWAAFSNCGQVCSGVERIYVARGRFDDFVAALAERARSLRIGHGSDPAIELGPLVSERQRARVEDLVADARERGADAIAGGGRPDVGFPGWFYEPTVLVGAPGSARIEREEVFGPVVTVAPFADEDDAVRLANDSPFGLGASVWTRDGERARGLARRLEAGSVWTNDHAYSYGACQASWGGTKGSGFGRTHSRYGLYECSQVKFVESDSGRVPVPWWYPYGDVAADGFRGVLGVLHGRGVTARAQAAWRHRRGLVGLARRYVSGP
jgi:succinate-semialdehyde dehydrogenase/glutarate-semialdehyde dehydrogenase